MKREPLSNTIRKIFFKNLYGQGFNRVGDTRAVIKWQFREDDDRDVIRAGKICNPQCPVLPQKPP